MSEGRGNQNKAAENKYSVDHPSKNLKHLNANSIIAAK